MSYAQSTVCQNSRSLVAAAIARFALNPGPRLRSLRSKRSHGRLDRHEVAISHVRSRLPSSTMISSKSSVTDCNSVSARSIYSAMFSSSLYAHPSIETLYSIRPPATDLFTVLSGASGGAAPPRREMYEQAEHARQIRQRVVLVGSVRVEAQARAVEQAGDAGSGKVTQVRRAGRRADVDATVTFGARTFLEQSRESRCVGFHRF